MKYLGILLLIALSACGTAPAPQQAGGVEVLEATAIKVGGIGIPPVVVGPLVPVPGPMDSVDIFKGPVGDNIPLNGQTNVPVNTVILMNFVLPQTPSLIQVQLTPLPWGGIGCTWTNPKQLKCSSNMVLLSYDTLYTVKVFKNSTLFGHAAFRTQQALMAP